MDKERAEEAIAQLHPYDQGDYQKLMEALETGDTQKGYEAISEIADNTRHGHEINVEMLLCFHRLRDYFLKLAKVNRFKNIKKELKAIAQNIDPDRVHQLSLFD